ncbi:MAG: hypothetical protein HY965_07560 [Ignavibacteriales bacterium]|nr:hypothetical protein [Ignavibacteriales bacterium]
MILRSNYYNRLIKKYNSLEDAADNRTEILALLEPDSIVLPEIQQAFNKIFRVKDAVHYNPYTPYCSCEEFLIARNEFTGANINVVCRHLHVFYQRNCSAVFTPVHFGLLELIHKFGKQSFYTFALDGNKIYAAYKESNEWLHIIIEQKPVQHYGFNLLSKRWSYNSKPAFSNELEEKISGYFAVRGCSL